MAASCPPAPFRRDAVDHPGERHPQLIDDVGNANGWDQIIARRYNRHSGSLKGFGDERHV